MGLQEAQVTSCLFVLFELFLFQLLYGGVNPERSLIDF